MPGAGALDPPFEQLLVVAQAPADLPDGWSLAELVPVPQGLAAEAEPVGDLFDGQQLAHGGHCCPPAASLSTGIAYPMLNHGPLTVPWGAYHPPHPPGSH